MEKQASIELAAFDTRDKMKCCVTVRSRMGYKRGCRNPVKWIVNGEPVCEMHSTKLISEYEGWSE